MYSKAQHTRCGSPTRKVNARNVVDCNPKSRRG